MPAEVEPHRLNVVFNEQRSGEQVEVAVEIPADDWSRLRRFRDKATALLSSRAVREALSGVKVAFEIGSEGLASTVQAPDDDSLAVLILRVRPFILESEPTSFAKMSGTLRRHLPHADLRGIVDRIGAEYHGKMAKSQMAVSVGETLLNGSNLVLRWLNAFEYHEDEEKRADFERLASACGGIDAVRGLVLSALYDMIRAVWNLGVVVSLIEERDRVVTLPAIPPRQAR